MRRASLIVYWPLSLMARPALNACIRLSRRALPSPRHHCILLFWAPSSLFFFGPRVHDFLCFEMFLRYLSPGTRANAENSPRRMNWMVHDPTLCVLRLDSCAYSSYSPPGFILPSKAAYILCHYDRVLSCFLVETRKRERWGYTLEPLTGGNIQHLRPWPCQANFALP